MSRIRRYSGDFSPKARPLSLSIPKGSSRRIIFFIGLFRQLEDLKLYGGALEFRESDPVGGMTLIPPFASTARMASGDLSDGGHPLRDMINLFEESHSVICISRRHLDVGETRLLLYACAKTLETRWFHPTDPRGKPLHLKRIRFPANAPTAESFLWTSISGGRSRPVHSRSWQGISRGVGLTHRTTPGRVPPRQHSRRSRPLRFWRSSSFTVTAIFCGSPCCPPSAGHSPRDDTNRNSGGSVMAPFAVGDIPRDARSTGLSAGALCGGVRSMSLDWAVVVESVVERPDRLPSEPVA